MTELTRLSYNETGWKRPTGEAAKLETVDTYNTQVGFGHEDWFFRDEWILGGWRDAFLQSVNKNHAKLLREALPLDVTLLTILPVTVQASHEFRSNGQCAVRRSSFVWGRLLSS